MSWQSITGTCWATQIPTLFLTVVRVPMVVIREYVKVNRGFLMFLKVDNDAICHWWRKYGRERVEPW